MAKHDSSEKWSDTKVGVVVLAALVLIVLGISFAGGDKGLLLRKRAHVKAILANVGGLKKGSSVMVGGMTIGKVAKMEFSAVNPSQIEITMEMREDIRQRIKTDSIPSVRTQGMLGDRYVDISAGSQGAGVLPEGQALVGQAATAFDETLEKAISVMNETNKILMSINEQKGTMGKLFYDEKFYDNLLKITDELDSLIKDFKKNPRRYIKFSVF